MSTLVIEPTSTAQWQALVSEAEHASHRHLDQTLESYLVFTLMRFVTRPEMVASVMGLEFLEGLNRHGLARQDSLRDVGDKCLLVSGLFPQRAERRRVRLSYFVDLGRSAYLNLQYGSHGHDGGLYASLAQDFVPMMDVLQAMRELDATMPGLDALTAFELWADTGSDHARRSLGRVIGDAIPVLGSGENRDTPMRH